MLSGVLTGNKTQHVEHNIRAIAHVHACRKDDSLMQRRLLLSPPPLKKKNQICTYIAYSACTILPLRHFCYTIQIQAKKMNKKKFSVPPRCI